jgi:hypothetical protein
MEAHSGCWDVGRIIPSRSMAILTVGVPNSALYTPLKREGEEGGEHGRAWAYTCTLNELRPRRHHYAYRDTTPCAQLGALCALTCTRGLNLLPWSCGDRTGMDPRIPIRYSWGHLSLSQVFGSSRRTL